MPKPNKNDKQANNDQEEETRPRNVKTTQSKNNNKSSSNAQNSKSNSNEQNNNEEECLRMTPAEFDIKRLYFKSIVEEKGKSQLMGFINYLYDNNLPCTPENLEKKR